MHQIKKSRLAIFASFGLGLGAVGNVAPAAASNLTINATFDSSITSLSNASAIESGIDAAITNFENDVTTNAPVSVSIDFKNVSTGLGASNTPQMDLNYSTYLADLQALPNQTANQISAYATLPAGPDTGINNTTQVNLTAANLAALGDTADANSLVSGNGGFNSTVSLNTSIMNISASDTNPNNYALQSVAAHEIDEVLGIGGNGSQLYQPGATPPATLPTDIGPLDLYRYSAPGVLSFTYDPTTSAYFSINGGVTNLVYFNQQNGANGSDFGDWGNPQGTADGNTPPQVQDAIGTPGAPPITLGPNELTGLNVAGYGLTQAGLLADGLTASAVPDPANLWLMLSGLLGIMGFRGRRKIAM
ncbi:MAG: NF038122 family metalloprotease [Methylomonas sp.]|jgi:hypothetical protein